MPSQTIGSSWKARISRLLEAEAISNRFAPPPELRPELYGGLKEDVIYIGSPHGDETDLQHFWAPLQLRFEHQLRTGCGSPTCTQSACRTFRARMRTKPLRQLTQASISATALMLSQDPQAEKHLCSDVPLMHEICQKRGSLPEKPADPSSFIQTVLATNTMRSALGRPGVASRTCLHSESSPDSRPKLPVLFKLELHTIQAVIEMIVSPDIRAKGQSTQAWGFLQRSCEYVLTDPWRLHESFREHNPHPIPNGDGNVSVSSIYMALALLHAFFGKQLVGWLTRATQLLGCNVENQDLDVTAQRRPYKQGSRQSAPSDEVFVFTLRIACEVLALISAEDAVVGRLVRREESNASIGLFQVLDQHLLDITQTIANRLAPWCASPPTADMLVPTSHVQRRDLHELVRTNLWIRLVRPIDELTIKHFDIQDQCHTGALQPLMLWLEVICQAGAGGMSSVRSGSPLDNAISTLGQAVHRMSKLRDLSLQGDYWDPGSFLELSISLGPLCNPDELVKSWMDPRAGHKPLLEYPFLLSGTATSDGTRVLVLCFRRICFIRMMKVFRAATLNNKMINTGFCWPTVAGLPDTQEKLDSLVHQHLPRGIKSALMPQLEIKVRRETMLDDALDHVWRRQKRHLLAPLKVKFGDAGEIAADLGGVAQEFFRLVAEKMQSPEYGLFTLSGSKQFAWFNPGSSEPSYRYCLLGMLIALAVHNGFTLPISFPSLLYRRLLDPSCSHGGLSGIEDGWPELVKGLRNLLEYDGNVEEDIGVDYTFPMSLPGQAIGVPMNKYTSALLSSRPVDVSRLTSLAGAEVPAVTNVNREQYVRDYVEFLTTTAIKEQSMEFARGFYSILDQSILATLTWQALRVLIEGHQDIDMLELQSATQYVQYSSQDETIQLFWAYVAELSSDRLKKLLEFVTATDRVPVNGLESLGFTIQKHGDDDEHLPSASTCFGILLLPAYSNAEVLTRKMDQALDNAEGFGLR